MCISYSKSPKSLGPKSVQLHWLKMGPRGYFRPENSGSRRKKKTTKNC